MTLDRLGLNDTIIAILPKIGVPTLDANLTRIGLLIKSGKTHFLGERSVISKEKKYKSRSETACIGN